MKNLPRFLVLGVLLLNAAPCLAEPNNLSKVAPEEITKLEKMHQQAEDYILKNEFDKALRVYGDILLLEPDDEAAYTGMGQIYLIQGKTQKAFLAYQNALTINPDNEAALAGIQKIKDPDGEPLPS